jgi:hypothetical protein
MYTRRTVGTQYTYIAINDTKSNDLSLNFTT